MDFTSPSQKTWNLDIEKNLKGREKMSRHFMETNSPTHLFLSSPSDWGVCRNGGRRGACFSPQALLHAFRSLTWDENEWPQDRLAFCETPVSSQTKEAEDFTRAQSEESQNIEKALKSYSQAKTIFHLGGGHDHIFPLLKSLYAQISTGLGVINVDAHCDTRVDELPHSGTPFRQFSQFLKDEGNEDFHLVQVGIHAYANPKENYSELPAGNMSVLSGPGLASNQLKELEKILTHESEKMWILSVDCDGLNANFMQAVSAVNHAGLTWAELRQLGQIYKQKCRRQATQCIGLYEYNPLFDDLSTKGAKSLAAFLYEML